jgi:hypothetical protein
MWNVSYVPVLQCLLVVQREFDAQNELLRNHKEALPDKCNYPTLRCASLL